jgi:hypothetical protein
MRDIFKIYELQREELLARIAESLQLDETRRIRMEQAYRAISEILEQDQGFFLELDVDVYPQGSVFIGTTVKPYKGSEFDLDIVLQINDLYNRFTPFEIYNGLLKKLEGDDRYKEKLEKKNRCIRINYANDFHMDILPGCIISITDKNTLKIPNRLLKDWAITNPKGFGEWFLSRANSFSQRPVLENYYSELLVELKARTEDLPSDNFYKKTPLQRAVQLVKRYRDVFFANNDQYATSSIVLTTLMGLHYQGEPSIYETIDNCVTRIKQGYTDAIANRVAFVVKNPVSPEEKFTDSWTPRHYEYFYTFIQSLHKNWQALKQDFQTSGQKYVELFDEGIYKQALRDQIRTLSKFSNSNLPKANGLIISDLAKTGTMGQIQGSNGYPNKIHHNYGE